MIYLGRVVAGQVQRGETLFEMHLDGSSAGLRIRPLDAGEDQAVEEVSQGASLPVRRVIGIADISKSNWLYGIRYPRDSTTPAIKTNDQHVDKTQDRDRDQDQDQQSYRHPSQSQSRTSESPDRSINPIGGGGGNQDRSNSFTGVGAAGPSYNLGGSGASLSAYSLAQPSRHQHHNKNQNYDPYLQSETPKSSNSNSNSTPGSGSDHNNNKPILPQPRRFPSIGTVFGYGESSALNDRLSTARPIDRENLTTLPLPGDAPNPLGILAEATISLDPGSSSSGSLPSSAFNHNHRNGKANNKDSNNRPPPEGTDYYSSSKKSVTPRTLKSEAPHIMQLISPSDAESLFETYWKKIHPHLPVLDRKRSACIDVASRSNYLFNASESESVLLNCRAWRVENVELTLLSSTTS